MHPQNTSESNYMLQRLNITGQKRRGRGIVIFYVLVSMVAMLGFCSLAVDLGRVQVAKTELRRAADAAARAAVANLSNGTAQAKTAAANMAAANKADGTSVIINTATDVQFINWTSKGNFAVVGTAAGANAVRVYCRRTTATNNPISLIFGGIVGVKSCDVTASAMATLAGPSSTVFVSGLSNPYLAGEPTGTKASMPDPNYPSSDHKWKNDLAGPNGGFAGSGQPYSSPVPVGFTVTPGSTITLTNVSGTMQYNPGGAQRDATGNQGGGGPVIYDNQAANGASEHGMSDIWSPIGSMVAVFLTSTLPDGNTPPQVLDFSTQAARDYTSLSPQNQQVFYTGDGQTSLGAQQQIIVPQGATRLFLGTMDGHEWSNNSDGFNATITQSNIALIQ
jgi:Flp pilus assembly protein TadG